MSSAYSWLWPRDNQCDLGMILLGISMVRFRLMKRLLEDRKRQEENKVSVVIGCDAHFRHASVNDEIFDKCMRMELMFNSDLRIVGVAASERPAERNKNSSVAYI